MKQIVSIGQVRPSVLSSAERIVKNWRTWLNARSRRMSALAGEPFTHGEVLKATAIGTALFLIVGLAARLEGGVA